MHHQRSKNALKTLAVVVGLVLSASAARSIDLEAAVVERLDNGLTLLVLEDHTFPVVSVQMLYKVGAAYEEVGRTGLAHFLEHMAFRASQHFPDTEVVSAIYAIGGEWHGYTWLDQTTYFETVPREFLGLMLRIEADRMGRLLIPADEVQAERGAVLAELHGYENDPAAVLKDAVLASSFLQHPYRNNTIGWESDVEKIEHEDLVAFYRRHYQPGNAVLAVVGAVSAIETRLRVEELFGPFAGAPPSPPPRTVEPPQRGERRIVLYGAGSRSRFEIAYRGPSVHDADWPAFLLLQDLLGGGEGVNFAQSEWGVQVRSGALLDGVVDGLVSWFPPMGQPYVFSLAGEVAADVPPGIVEIALEDRISRVRRTEVTPDRMAQARSRVLDALLFDVETTEDAAHQLAYFEGLGGLEVLLSLPDRVAAVRAGDIQSVAQRLLQPHQRTIGWYLAGSAPADPRAPQVIELPAATGPGGVESPATSRAAEPPVVMRLGTGLPVIFQQSSFSPTAFLRVLVPNTETAFEGDAGVDAPVWRHTSLNHRFRREELEEVLRRARAELASAVAPGGEEARDAEDPVSQLRAAFREHLGLEPGRGEIAPVAVIVAGDLEPEATLEALERAFGDLPVAAPVDPVQLRRQSAVKSVHMDVAKAQARLGYAVAAPPPSHPDHLPWRILLYVLTHGYEGRLGKEAITRRGLIYYISSRYETDGNSAWIALDMGVDPPKLHAMREQLEAGLEDLQANPPTAEELTEARQHLIGRRTSASQSNAELSAALAREWIGVGRLRTQEEYGLEVSRVSGDDLIRVLRDFVAGTVVTVSVEH